MKALVHPVGGLVLAGVLLVLAVIMTSKANFSKNDVNDQLSQHPEDKTVATRQPARVAGVGPYFAGI